MLHWGSRKCVLCRHISKSPAMLEKHMNRHLQCCIKSGEHYQCSQCGTQASSQQEMLDHMVVHSAREGPMLQCEHCRYRSVFPPSLFWLTYLHVSNGEIYFRGQTERSLQQHVLFKHTSDMFSRKFTCTHCLYASTDPISLAAHCEKMHPEEQHSLNEQL